MLKYANSMGNGARNLPNSKRKTPTVNLRMDFKKSIPELAQSFEEIDPQNGCLRYPHISVDIAQIS